MEAADLSGLSPAAGASRSGVVNPHGPTPGAMQGDSYPLEILLGRLSEAAGMSRP